MTQCLSDFSESEIDEDENDFDIIIIGAGLSGLAAANRLIRAGLNILILEQKDSSGGRLLNNEKSKSFYAHSLQSRLNHAIASLHISKIQEKYSNTRKIVHLDKSNILNDSLSFYISGEVYLFLKTIDKISKTVYFKTYKKERFNQKLSNTSVEDVLCQLIFFQKSRSICRNLVYATCGITQLKHISCLWFFIMLNGGGGFLQRLRVNLGDNKRYFIKGGAMNLAQLLTKNIDNENKIHYHESANKIQYNDDRSYVWTNKGRYKCSYVILAIPPIECSEILVESLSPTNIKEALSSYYKENNVFFNVKTSQLSEINNLTKNIIGSENYKTNLRLAYDATCTGENEFCIAGFLSKANINLTMKNNFTSILNLCFKSNKIKIKDYVETDCSFIPGGSPMNVLKPGNLRTHLNLLSEIHDRVFFAASEYAIKWPGTIDGAIEAGESAALSVLKFIRPQAINNAEWALSK